jgi:hypothetical protein
MMQKTYRLFQVACYLSLVCLLGEAGGVASAVPVDLSHYRADSGISVVSPDTGSLLIRWPISTDLVGQVVLDLMPDQPLIRIFSRLPAGGDSRHPA